MKDEADITLLKIGLVNNGLGHAGVFQHMLANVGLQLENIIGPSGFRGGAAIWATLRSAVALIACCFRHHCGSSLRDRMMRWSFPM